MSGIKEWAHRWIITNTPMRGAFFDPKQREYVVQLSQEAYERGLHDGKLAQIMTGETIRVPGGVALESNTVVKRPQLLPLSERPASQMTVRERFALQFMDGRILALQPWSLKDRAEFAIGVADALIAALEAKP